MFASQLSTHINEKGHKAIIVFVFPGSAPLPFSGETRHLNGSPKKRMWDVQAWRKLAQIIKAEKPDVIQANAGDTLKYAVLSKLYFKWKQPIVFRNASTISLYIKSAPAKIL
ncbi:MAG TPA: glycosyltransferase, partial [Niastella sp.]|nr:glycosyltransferase [Niastella sp.]